MKKIYAYIFLSYGLAWTIWFVLWLKGIQLGKPMSQLATIIAMWMPALAYFILKKAFPHHYHLQARFCLYTKLDKKYVLLAAYGPFLLTLLGTSLYFLVFRNQFSLQFDSLAQMIETYGGNPNAAPLNLVALAQIISAVTYAPLINSLFALGEEIGWRGYLYPALREKFSPLQSHLLVGLIWSFWHLPLNLQGYNFGLTYRAFPFVGILAMFLFCFSVGVFLSWILEKTGSIWLPALLHGAINASAGIGILFQVPSNQAMAMKVLGPSPAGLLSGIPFLLLALFLIRKERKSS